MVHFKKNLKKQTNEKHKALHPAQFSIIHFFSIEKALDIMNIPILFFKMSTLKPSYHRTSKACSQLNQPDSYHKTPRSLEFFGNATNIQGQMFIQCLSVKCNSLTECQTFVGYIFLPFPLIFIVTCCCCQFLFHHHHPIHQLPRHLLFSILFFFFLATQDSSSYFRGLFTSTNTMQSHIRVQGEKKNQ